MASYQLTVWLDGKRNKQTNVAIEGTGFTNGQAVSIAEAGGTGRWSGTLKTKDIYAGGTIAVVKVKCDVEPTSMFSAKSVELEDPDDTTDVDVTVDGSTSDDPSEVVISEEP